MAQAAGGEKSCVRPVPVAGSQSDALRQRTTGRAQLVTNPAKFCDGPDNFFVKWRGTILASGRETITGEDRWNLEY